MGTWCPKKIAPCFRFQLIPTRWGHFLDSLYIIIYREISPMPGCDSNSAGAPSDSEVQEEIHDRDENEGDQHHHQKVCCQDIVPRVGETLSQV